jgi:hypothetical protein
MPVTHQLAILSFFELEFESELIETTTNSLEFLIFNIVFVKNSF